MTNYSSQNRDCPKYFQFCWRMRHNAISWETILLTITGKCGSMVLRIWRPVIVISSLQCLKFLQGCQGGKTVTGFLRSFKRMRVWNVQKKQHIKPTTVHKQNPSRSIAGRFPRSLAITVWFQRKTVLGTKASGFSFPTPTPDRSDWE